MKKVALIFSFVALVTVVAQAQTKNDTTPVWTISKGVQQLQFKDVNYLPARITTTNQVVALSKGIHNVNQQAEVKGRVSKSGYPAWTISKGAARFQYEASR